MRLPTVRRPWAGRGRLAALLMTLATAAAFTLGLSLTATPASAGSEYPPGHSCDTMDRKNWEQIDEYVYSNAGAGVQVWRKKNSTTLVVRVANYTANGKTKLEARAAQRDYRLAEAGYTQKIGKAPEGAWCSANREHTIKGYINFVAGKTRYSFGVTCIIDTTNENVCRHVSWW
jgi:hypothetical protein